MNTRIKQITSDWEEVYSVQKVTRELFSEKYYEDEGFTYYQTFAGSPERGYFANDDSVYQVSRALYQEFRLTPLKNTRIEYEAADEMKGKTARCRLVEEVNLTATRKIIDEHGLWGNAIEIVKCLRDGLDPKVDASYKDLCLGIILHHFQYIDEYLDILPKDSCPTYKELLQDLKKKHLDKEDESESESEDSDSESEDDLELEEAYREGKKDGYAEAYSEIHQCEECHKPTRDVRLKCDNTEAQGVSFVCKPCEQKK